MSKSFDGSVQPVLELHERITWPEPVSELISTDQVPRTLEQDGQNVQRLALHLDLVSLLAKLTRSEIEFETLEMDGMPGGWWLSHTPSPPLGRNPLCPDNFASSARCCRLVSVAILSPL